MRIGLRGRIARRGGKATRVTVRATITAEKGASGIRVLASHLHGVVDGLEGIEAAQLREIARATEEGCTLSNAIRASYEVAAADGEGGDSV